MQVKTSKKIKIKKRERNIKKHKPSLKYLRIIIQ